MPQEQFKNSSDFKHVYILQVILPPSLSLSLSLSLNHIISLLLLFQHTQELDMPDAPRIKQLEDMLEGMQQYISHSP